MMVGHNRILRFLQNSIQSRRVAHAYGFFGPDGVGKATAARLFARGLLCANAFPHSSLQECEKCSCASCRAVQTLTHPDLRFLSPSSGKEIGIEEIRELLGFLAFTPFAGSHKIVVIDDAHRLTPQAASALLKTLEDPPPRSLLILVSSSPERMLATLRSRLVPVRFRRLAAHEFGEALKDVTGGEDRSAEEHLLRLAGGRPGFAMEWRKELASALPHVQELLHGDFRKRFTLLTRRGKGSDLPLERLLELSVLIFRDALIQSLEIRGLTLLTPPPVGSQRSVAELMPTLRLLLSLLRFSTLFNLSPKLTRDTFLFTAPQLQSTPNPRI